MTHRIGVLVPFTNTNLEADFAQLCPPDTSMHYARLGGYDADEIPDETQMAGLGAAPLDDPLAMIMGVAPDVVVYGCTSATLTHGRAFDQDLARRITALSGAKTVTAAGALVHALDRLGIRKFAFTSPYVGAINRMAVGFLEETGRTCVHMAEVAGALGNEEQGALTPKEVLALGLDADHPQAEAIVLSCTDMRSVECIPELEARTGKPVLCSNQAMLFQAMQMLSMATHSVPCGRLFQP